jgi:hypothetical protein
LILLYINSVPASLLKGKLIMFVDDIAPFNWEKLKQTVEINLRYTYDWIKKNILSLNINKSVCMPTVTTRLQLSVGYSYVIHNCGTGMINCIKYLRTTIDFNLK